MQITLLTRDDARLIFDYAGEQDVLAAAEAAGLYPPAMCHEGSCGLCAGHVADGAYEMGPHSPQALPPGDGGVLLCRCQPRGDLTITLPCTDAQIGRHRVPERAAEITGITPAADGTLALSLRVLPDAALGQAVDFQPGQYMELGVPALGLRRAYSPANLPNWEGRLDFLIRLVPGGAFTGWLARDARPGAELTLRGPLGDFMLDEASPRPRLFIAGGCGLAPIFSMLRHMADFQDGTPAQLIYGANREEELLPAEAFADLQTALPQLGITLCLWHPAPGWQGFTGTTADALEALLAQAGSAPDIYVCGPPRMLAAVEAVAEAHTIPPAQFFTERLPH